MRHVPVVLAVLPLALACRLAFSATVDPTVAAHARAEGSAEALIVLAEQAPPPLAPMRLDADYRMHRRTFVEALQARATAQQAGVRAWLDAHGIAYRPYWIANVIWARLSAAELDALRNRADIARVAANPPIAARLPRGETQAGERPAGTAGISWGVLKIGAPTAWDAGYTGQGVVIAGEDTGYQWDHPALKTHYRGWDEATQTADHAYNWHDAIHDASPGNPCDSDASAPCDDYGHGTHTAGTFAGGDGAEHQTGVAPGAQWIGCRNMDGGVGTPARYIECMQWLVAPTDADDANPNPDLAPDVINNSWGCPTDEGCTVGDELEQAVDNLVAAGVFYVASAGNDGPGCSSITAPPAIYDASFVVGASTSGDTVWSSSSRGAVAGVTTIRPDLIAPGVQVPSAWLGTGYNTISGTSMAGPHVAGTAALMMSANPALRGHPDRIAAILHATTRTAGIVDNSNSGCGGLTMADWPNYQAGYGRVDAWAAVQAAVIEGDTLFRDGFDG